MIKDPPKTLKIKERRMGKFLKIRQKIGKVICLLAIAGSIYGIFVIAADKSTSENIGWGVDFSIAMFQDLILTPLLFIGSQYIIYRISFSKTIKSTRFKSYISTKLLDPNVALIYSKWLGEQSKSTLVNPKRTAMNRAIASPIIKGSNIYNTPSDDSPSRTDLLQNTSANSSLNNDLETSTEFKPKFGNIASTRIKRAVKRKNKLINTLTAAQTSTQNH